MTTPIVIEIAPQLEPVTADPFLAGLGTAELFPPASQIGRPNGRRSMSAARSAY